MPQDRQEILAEAYRRNLMPPERRLLYEEAMRRGLVTGYERSMGQRLLDNVQDGWERSGAGQLQRRLDPEADGIDPLREFFDITHAAEILEGKPADRLLDATLGQDRTYLRSVNDETRRDAPQIARERARRASYAARAEADPIRNAGDSAAFLAGQIIGGAASPESWVAPGATRVGRITGAVAVNAAVDVGLQAGDVGSGVQDEYDPIQTVGAAALGGLISGGLEVGGFVRRAFTDPPRVPPPDPSLVGTGTEGIEVGLPDGTVVDVPRVPAPDAAAKAVDEIAAVAPVVPDFDSVRPMPRNTFLARQERALTEKGLPRYLNDLLQARYTEVKAEAHPIVLMSERMRGQIERITGRPEDLLPSQNPAILARGLNDVANIGQTDIVAGVHAYHSTAKPTTPALRDIVMAATARDKRGGGNVEVGMSALGKYAAARRAIAEWTNFEKGTLENRPTRQTREELEAFVTRLDTERPELRELSDNLNLYAEGLLKKKLDAGLLNPETYAKALGARDFYTPLKRYAKLTEGRSGAIASKSNKGDAVKTYSGLTDKQAAAGNDEFVDPIQVLADETFRLAERVRANDLNRSLVNMAAKLDDLLGPEGNSFMRKVDRPIERLDEPTSQADLFGEPEAIFRPGEINDNGMAVLYVWNDGKREAWELLDPEWGTMAFDALSSMTRQQSDLFVNAVASVTGVWRASVTKNPGFLFVNFVRDAFESWALTDVVSPLSGLKGIADQVTGADASRMYNLGGGIAGGELQAGRDGILRQKDTPELARAYDPKDPINSARARYLNWRGIGRGAMDIFRVTELSEVGVRQSIFTNAMKRAKKMGLDDYDALLEAAHVARDYSDFGRRGSKVHAVTRMFAFLNPWAEGIDKLIRTAATDPASAVGRAYQFGGHEAAMKAILKPLLRQDLSDLPVRQQDRAALKLAVHAWTRMAAMGTFGLGLTGMFWNDPDWRNEDERTRATHWIIPDFMGVNIKIPKPYGTAFLSNAFERAYEAEHGNDESAWGRMWEGMVDIFAPPGVAPALDTVTGLKTGVDPQTGRDIVSPYQEGLPPELQYTAWTSGFAKSTADALRAVGIDVAPAKVDYFFRSFGGTTGTDALNMMDATNPDRPAGRMSDWPVIRRFASPSFKGAQDKADFFERAAAQTSTLQRALAGVREYTRINNPEAANRILADLDRPGQIYVLSQQGEASTDRLNPISRAQAVGRQTSRMIGELNGMAVRGENAQPLPPMSRQRRRMVVDALERLAVAEMGNAMIVTNQPGFAQREMWDRDSLWHDIELMAPEVADEMEYRLARGDYRAYAYDVVMEGWPEVASRIESDGSSARLDDLARRAASRSRISRYDRPKTEDPEPLDLRVQ